MIKMFAVSAVALAILMGSSLREAEASALSMSYDITDPGSGSYTYDFRLKLDNHDGSWIPGDSYDWIVFGDIAGTFDSFDNQTNAGASPLGPNTPSGFVGDPASLPIGPFTNFNYSSGGHNGPTLVNFEGGWKPVAINDTLSWSGISPNFVGQGDLRFSTLMNINVDPNVPNPDAVFEVATLNNVVVTPEPASMLLYGIGGAVLTVFRRRKHA